MTDSSTGRRSVLGGACMRFGQAAPCALDSNDCPADTAWDSSRELSNAGNAHGGACATRTFTEEASIGRCGGRCTSHASACANPSDFMTASDVRADTTKTCTIRQDDQSSTPTLFGSCDDACFWSKDDCSGTWKPAGTNPECTCENVRVGACIHGGFHWCAVSATACDDRSPFISAKELLETKAADCFLCRKESDGSTNEKPVDVDSGEEVSPIQLNRNGGDDGPDTAVIAGATVGAVVGVALLVAIFFMLRSTRQKRYNPNKTVSDIPTDTEQAAAANVDPSEDLSDDGSDVA
mmetsp:Transcript_3622/g.9607  ORF Transcript_3622/g.9607 Transcript_3622/m.9607 type:complete len:294 (+) Transcript_3622:762-1643(+)